MNILITGSNGFIGSYLVRYFHEGGHQVYALIHKAYRAAIPEVEYRQFDLHSFGTDIIPNDIDAIIHTAYIPYVKGNNSDEINFTSTKRLLSIARKKKVSNFVFLSSFSAMPDALSHYGRNKWQLQQLFDPDKELVLRPGLVLGKGGLFNNMLSIIKSGKIIPLIGGGKQPLQTIYIEDLAKVIESAITKKARGIYSVAEKEDVYLKDFNIEMSNLLEKKTIFLPIPYFAAEAIFYTLDFLKIKSKIGIENYLGLKQMKHEPVCNSEEVFDTSIRSFIDSLNLLINNKTE